MKKVWYIYFEYQNIGQAATKQKAIELLNHHTGVNVLVKEAAYIGKDLIRYNGYVASLEEIKP